MCGILAYCVAFQSQFGIFSLTDASPRQNIKVCIDRGYYKDFTDAKVVQFIDDTLEAESGNAWQVAYKLTDTYGNAAAQKLAKDYFRTHAARYAKDTLVLIWNYRTAEMGGYGEEIREGSGGLYNFCTLLAQEASLILQPFEKWLNVYTIYLLSALWGVVMVVVWVRRKSPPWVHMALFAILVCTTFLTFVITCGEYMRTMITVVPYAFICLAMAVQWISDRSRGKERY